MDAMFELAQERSKPFDFVSLRRVTVLSNGNKYITVEGGHCSKYRKDCAKIFGLDGRCIAYCPMSDYSNGKYDTLLFPEEWMAQVYVYRKGLETEAQQILNKVGLHGLSEAALREICKCGQEDTSD